jgi:hypothetical protein
VCCYTFRDHRCSGARTPDLPWATGSHAALRLAAQPTGGFPQCEDNEQLGAETDSGTRQCD